MANLALGGDFCCGLFFSGPEMDLALNIQFFALLQKYFIAKWKWGPGQRDKK